MPDMQGIEHVIRTAQDAAEPTPLDHSRRFYAVLERADEFVKVIDLDEIAADSTVAEHPVRKIGTAFVNDAASFVAYVMKHGEEHTEVWADPVSNKVTAVLDAHYPAGGPAGWGGHRVELYLALTDQWKLWCSLDGKMLPQTEFADLIEKRSIDFDSTGGYVNAADMLELAQTFKTTGTLQFESSQRVKSGETQLVYLEEQSATAGRQGELAVPDVFRLALPIFVGGKPYAVYCRLRWRIERGSKALRLGFVMEQPEDVVRAAFDSYVDQIKNGETAFPGIIQPVWMGSPISL